MEIVYVAPYTTEDYYSIAGGMFTMIKEIIDDNELTIVWLIAFVMNELPGNIILSVLNLISLIYIIKIALGARIHDI